MLRIEVCRSWLGCFPHGDGGHDRVTILPGQVELSGSIFTALAAEKLVKYLLLITHLAMFIFLPRATQLGRVCRKLVETRLRE